MSRPLVLNTRPREQAGQLTALLRAAGYEVVEKPATEIVPAWDCLELARVCDDLRAERYAWIVLQSANAARGLPLGSARILCGSATARALGVDAAEVLERFSAKAALEVLSQRVQVGDRVLVPRAAEGRDELIDGLRALGVDVDAPIAYRTLSLPLAGVANEPIAIVTLCSPSAARAVFDALGVEWLAQRRMVCLGATTAQAVSDAGLRVDATAEHTSMASLVEAVGSVREVPV